MGKSLGELHASMDSEEITLRLALAELEPFGSAVEDERAGVIAATVRNNRGMISPPKESLWAGDFFPRIRGPEKRKTQRELREAAKRVAKRGRG
jgi:hypothetical protein